MILTLQALNAPTRDIYLFDTFEGMTAPTDEDVSDLEGSAAGGLVAGRAREPPSLGGDVRRPRCSTRRASAHSCSTRRIRLSDCTSSGARSRGQCRLRPPRSWRCSDSTPTGTSPPAMSSIHLFPRLRQGGVLIIDDYGHWRGARKAVDEYFGIRASTAAAHPARLHRATGGQAVRGVRHERRVGVKPSHPPRLCHEHGVARRVGRACPSENRLGGTSRNSRSDIRRTPSSRVPGPTQARPAARHCSRKCAAVMFSSRQALRFDRDSPDVRSSEIADSGT